MTGRDAAERAVSEAAVLATAIKMLEALASPCEVNANGRHVWNECRRCRASIEDIDTEHGRVMCVAVLRRLRGEA